MGVVGTSYMMRSADCDKRDTDVTRERLSELNGQLQRNLDELTRLGARYMHGVDATKLDETLITRGIADKYDRIIFPFPRASLRVGVTKESNDLMQGFFKNAAEQLKPGGEIHTILHINATSFAQFDYWSIRDCAEAVNIEWVGAVPFDFKRLRGYQPRDMAGRAWTP